MKKLQVEFQSNANGCGLQTFKQIKREHGCAIYQRIRKDGTTHCFEVFFVKVVPKGASLPDGSTVQESYEQYPGASAFGRFARCRKTLDQAEQRLTEIAAIKEEAAKEAIISSSDEKSDDAPKVKGKRGRKPVDTSKITIPQDKFDMDQLHVMNPHVSRGWLYVYLTQTLIPQGRAVAVESISGGRGKPRIIYKGV